MARLYFVNRGVPGRWQDRRNWSRKPGGVGGAGQPTVADTLVLSRESSCELLDLGGCPHANLTIQGFVGKVVLPNGSEFNMVAPKSEQEE